MMQNNIGMIMQAMRNPQAFMQQAMNNSQLMQNPISRNAIEMYQSGDKTYIAVQIADTTGLTTLVSGLYVEIYGAMD